MVDDFVGVYDRVLDGVLDGVIVSLLQTQHQFMNVKKRKVLQSDCAALPTDESNGFKRNGKHAVTNNDGKSRSGGKSKSSNNMDNGVTDNDGGHHINQGNGKHDEKMTALGHVKRITDVPSVEDENRLLSVIETDDNHGVTQKELEGSTELKGWTTERIASGLNGLLKRKKLNLIQDKNGTLVYKAANDEEEARFKGLGDEELLVFQLIAQCTNFGIWSKDLRIQSNLQQPQMTKALKVLEGRELIKAVKSVTSRNRKVYMLAELEPSKEITGGAWYTEHEFDAEFITVLTEACHRFILSKGEATLEEIAAFVREKGVSRVELRLEDVSQVVHTLVYDGKIDAIEDLDSEDGGSIIFKAATLAIPTTSVFSSVLDAMDEWDSLFTQQYPHLQFAFDI